MWFSDQKLRRAKKPKVKVSQFAIATNTLTHPQPIHYTFSLPEFLVFISGFFCFLFTWYSVIRTKFLSYVKAGATQTEMSLLKQYLAGERVDLLEIFMCSNTVSMIWKGSVSKNLAQPSPPNQF